MSNNTQDTDQPIRLQNAQRALRDAYFSHDSGLFTLPCVAGAGKSTTDFRITAEDLLRSYVDGNLTPEQHIAVVSFNTDEAAKIIPKICDHLRAIVEHDLRPVGSEVSKEEVEYLIQRIQQAPFIGTIDSILGDVFQQFAGDIGFDEMPSVGNDAVLARIHADCYEALSTNPSYSDEVAALEAAYPDGEYDDSPAEMLESALKYCRNQRLSTAEFRNELVQTRQAVYEEPPGEFDSVVAAVEHVVDDDSIGTAVRDCVDKTADRDRLATADERLYDAWGDRIDDFCSVLAAYRIAYRTRTREYGAVSHTDVAFFVASYLDETLHSFTGIEASADLRQRILQRYHSRLQSLIIDEAQDVSEIQHTALSQLVHPEMRLCISGDILQSIYQWRHANPALFESATANGEYLGINWATHKNEPATTTYRCVPDIAQAINSIAEPMFVDAARGDIGALDAQQAYNTLTAARDADDQTAVHISGFRAGCNPGSEPWVNPENGSGEADQLAKYLSNGLADGTFTDADGDPLSITVLFRRTNRMSDYEDAFEDAGLRVRNTNSNLFSSPAVKLVLRVCDWLVDPEAPDRTKQLVTEGGLGLSSLADESETPDWHIEALLASDDSSAAQEGVLADLQKLRDQRDTCQRLPASTYIEDIIKQLGLRADTHNLCPETDARQRVANLDGLVDVLTQWEDGDQYTPAELTDLVAPFREKPKAGPAQPSTTTSAHDVEFRTVHRAKGDEDDIVAIGDLGYTASTSGVQQTRLITQGPIAGLAPPTNVDIPTDIDIPPLKHGLYDPSAAFSRDIGLRWGTTRWADSVTAAAPRNDLLSPAPLQHVIKRKRAELWRLLYVVLTRARDHLVMPLPDNLQYDLSRDRWIETLRRGLEYNGGTESYPLSTSQGEITIGVNDADIHASRPTRQINSPEPLVTTTSPEPGALAPWAPRFWNPSTLSQLTEKPSEHAVAHLLGESIHTEANDAAQQLGLPFDTMGPDEIGSVIHDTLTELISQGVSEAELTDRDDIVTQTFDDIVSGAAPALDDADRDKLWEFFTDILDDFIDSELWSLIQAAESVRVEKAIDGLVTTDTVEVELHGQVDIVIDFASGKQVVSDLKIALADPTQATQRRYNLQVASYAFLFGQQRQTSESVQPMIATFGVNTKTMTISRGARLVERAIRNFVD